MPSVQKYSLAFGLVGM